MGLALTTSARCGIVLGVTTLLDTLGMFCDLILRITLLGKHHYSYFTEDETES